MSDLYPKDGRPLSSGADYGYGTDHPVQADIPAHAAPQNTGRGGLATSALAVLGLVLKFKGLALTFVSTALSALVYAQLFGWWAFGIGFVLLILVHESGHLVAARALGMPVSLPVMIPGLGAFVSMKQPRSVAHEAQMAVGGPILGALAAAACYWGSLVAPSPYWRGLLGGLAYFGFLINLFNLIPVTPLDGGRVLSIVSKWFNVAGLAIAVGLLVIFKFSNPLLILIVLVGAFSTWQRFRSTAADPGYYQVPASTKWVIGGLYIALLIALVLGTQYTHDLLPSRLS